MAVLLESVSFANFELSSCGVLGVPMLGADSRVEGTIGDDPARRLRFCGFGRWGLENILKGGLTPESMARAEHGDLIGATFQR